MQLNWSDVANDDLDQIEAYISKDSSPVIAIDVILAIIDTTHLVLPEHPGAGRLGRLKGTRELVIDGVPFIVIYRLLRQQSQLQILRVLHETQQWPTA